MVSPATKSSTEPSEKPDASCRGENATFSRQGETLDQTEPLLTKRGRGVRDLSYIYAV